MLTTSSVSAPPAQPETEYTDPTAPIVTGWRSWLKQSDANLMIPPMTAEQREAFFETVEEDGQINVPVTLYYSGEKPSDAVLAKPGWWKQPSHLKHTELGDGANRLDAGEIVLDINWKEECADLFRVLFLKGGGPSGENIDPWKMTFGLNLKRRQLNSNQYRDLVRDMRRKFPDLPALQIAKRIGISPTTVGKYTEELEAAGDISSVEVSKDTRGRASPTRKPRKTAAEKAAEKRTAYEAEEAAAIKEAGERKAATQEALDKITQATPNASSPAMVSAWSAQADKVVQASPVAEQAETSPPDAGETVTLPEPVTVPWTLVDRRRNFIASLMRLQPEDLEWARREFDDWTDEVTPKVLVAEAA